MTPTIFFEVQPTRFREKFEKELAEVEKFTRRIHIPDSPLGYPKVHVLALSSLAINRGFEVTIHLRTIDQNENGIINTVYGANLIGVQRILFLRGDPPTYGKPCESISPEKAIGIVKSDKRLSSLRTGLILSLRFPLEKILERVKLANPDFVLIMNNELEKLRVLRSEYGGIIMVYLIVVTNANRGYITFRLGSRDSVNVENLEKRMLELEGLADELLISAPRAVSEVSRVLGEAYAP